MKHTAYLAHCPVFSSSSWHTYCPHLLLSHPHSMALFVPDYNRMHKGRRGIGLNTSLTQGAVVGGVVNTDLCLWFIPSLVLSEVKTSQVLYSRVWLMQVPPPWAAFLFGVVGWHEWHLWSSELQSNPTSLARVRCLLSGSAGRSNNCVWKYGLTTLEILRNRE